MLSDDVRQMPRPLRRITRALAKLPVDSGLVCKFVAKAVFLVAAQSMMAHHTAAGAPAASLSPFQGLPDLIPHAALFLQGDDLLSSALEGITSSLTTLARATSGAYYF